MVPLGARLRHSLAAALALRLGLALVAYLAARHWVGSSQPLGVVLAEALTRWDARHYLAIAEEGYTAEPEGRHRIAFFPLFPLLVRGLHQVIGGWALPGALLALLASVVAGALLQVVASDGGADEAEAGRALLHLSVFPTAYFLAVPYPEALFLALVLGCFAALQRGRLALAGGLAALACATRMQGLALWPALVLEAARLPPGQRRRGSWLLLAPLGFAAYLAVNGAVLGDPLGFLRVQRDAFSQQVAPPWRLFQEAATSLSGPPSPHRTLAVEAPLAGALLAIAALLAGARWLRPSHQVYAWSTLALCLLQSFPVSLPRYLLSLFPIFLVSARLCRSPGAQAAWLLVFAPLMAAYAALFLAGRWAF